jgi:hypothetical protein
MMNLGVVAAASSSEPQTRIIFRNRMDLGVSSGRYFQYFRLHFLLCRDTRMQNTVYKRFSVR